MQIESRPYLLQPACSCGQPKSRFYPPIYYLPGPMQKWFEAGE